MTFTAIGLCSRALIKLGAGSISSFEEETTEAHVAKQLYDTTVNALLASYPWRFALTQTSLARLTGKPTTDFRYAYALPNDCVRILSVGTSARSSGVSYRLCQNQLHTNQENVVLTYIARPTEALFPAFFTQALISRLAAEFCLPLTESTSRTDYLRKIADEEMKSARLIDSQQIIPSAFQDFSLIEVRG